MEELVIPYLPYARQDRVCLMGEAQYINLSLRLITQAAQGIFKRITVFDVHNKDSLKDSIVTSHNPLHPNVLQYMTVSNGVAKLPMNEIPLPVSPDSGAGARTSYIASQLWDRERFLPFYKKRGEDGSVTYSPPDMGSQNRHKWFSLDVSLLIVDDICDGGRTFMSLAGVLPAVTCKKILYVTHGIFSYGVDDLLKHYDEIWCWHAKNPERFEDNPRVIIANQYLSGNNPN
jgi:ribose-phosphate pyrophosphokinase